MAFSGGRPATDNLDQGDEVAIPNLLLVLSQKRLALDCVSCPLVAPAKGILPWVKVV